MTEQPTLPMEIPEADWTAVEDAHGHYTCERLQMRHPRIYRGIVELLGCGVPIKTIARVLSVSIQSIMAVREKQAEAITTVKARVSTRLMGLGELQAEIAQASLAQMLATGTTLDAKELKDLLIGMGITLEKGLLTAGEATARVAMQSAPAHDDYLTYLKNVTDDVTHLSGAARAEKGRPAGSEPDRARTLADAGVTVEMDAGQVPARLALGDGQKLADEAVSDTESEVSCEKPKENGGEA